METTAQSRLERLDTATGQRVRFDPGPVPESDSVGWTGFRLERWTTRTGGVLPETVLFDNVVTLNLGPTVRSYGVWPGARSDWQQMERGAISILPAGIPYACESRDAWDGLIFSIVPSALDRLLVSDGGHGVVLPPVRKSDNALIVQSLLALQRDMRLGHPWGAIYGETICAALAVEMASQFALSRPGAGRLKLRQADCRFVLDYIDQHLHRSMQLTELASLVGMSPFAFARAFKAGTGVAPHRYIVSKRIEAAKALLRDSDEPLVNVAVRCGFASQSHFSDVFHRSVGFTPRAYRRISGRRVSG